MQKCAQEDLKTFSAIKIKDKNKVGIGPKQQTQTKTPASE
jgi:hypothetical protein